MSSKYRLDVLFSASGQQRMHLIQCSCSNIFFEQQLLVCYTGDFVNEMYSNVLPMVTSIYMMLYCLRFFPHSDICKSVHLTLNNNRSMECRGDYFLSRTMAIAS